MSNILRATSKMNNSSKNSLKCGEQPPLRGPSKQELSEFRKLIEAGNWERVNHIIWANPRYLISSGDTPTNLKEGCRYNAMHICAQSNQARIAELILKTISDGEFIQIYTGNRQSGEMIGDMNRNLLDYYLNLPDKGRGETPLHFAVKNGHIAVVEVLVSYPQCKSLRNADGKEPKDIICQRAGNASREVIEKLKLLLSEPHYVPVLRALGNELPPQVGAPFTTKEPPNLQRKSQCIDVELKISGLAGPMAKEQALNFYRRWKTPPRIGSNVRLPFANTSLMSANKSLPVSPLIVNRPMPSKVISSVPRHMQPELASTPQRQMQPELFLKYRSQTSLLNDSLDCSLNASVSTLNDSYRERHIKNSDIEKGLELIGRQLARQEQLDWREYWGFLDAFVDIASSEGLALFEEFLSVRSKRMVNEAWNCAQLNHCVELLALEADKPNHVSQVLTPYICVEKSLQVFARRITKRLINNIGNLTVNIKFALRSEQRRLKSLIVSFKEDARFSHVDFRKVHSRVSHLVGHYIAHSLEFSKRSKLLKMLNKILKLKGDHLFCFCYGLLIMLEQQTTLPDVQLPVAHQTEELCVAAWDREQRCCCFWIPKRSRQTSRRNRNESLNAQAQDFDIMAGNTEDQADETIYYDCNSSCEDEDVFMTPPDSPPWLQLEPRYELFIYGKEPTKPDWDVFNAIYQVQIDEKILPFVHAWRATMDNLSIEEKLLFTPTKPVQDSPKPTMDSVSNGSCNIVADRVPPPVQRKLFATPKLNALAAAVTAHRRNSPLKSEAVAQPFMERLNRLASLD